MGLPVIAGDGDVAALYKAHIGSVPYTFAGDQSQLEHAIERLATDAAFYEAEAARVSRYVLTTHDYPAVARRYEEMLAKHMDRPDIVTTEAPAVPSARPRKRGKAA